MSVSSGSDGCIYDTADGETFAAVDRILSPLRGPTMTLFARTSTRKKGKILCPDYYVIRGTLAAPLVHEFMYLAVIGLIF